jgi:hypothetical protein
VPLNRAKVVFTLTGPDGRIVSKSDRTNKYGNTAMRYKIPNSAPPGSYTVSAAASLGIFSGTSATVQIQIQ